MVQARYHTTISDVELAADIEEYCEDRDIKEAEFVREAIRQKAQREIYTETDA